MRRKLKARDGAIGFEFDSAEVAPSGEEEEEEGASVGEAAGKEGEMQKKTPGMRKQRGNFLGVAFNGRYLNRTAWPI